MWGQERIANELLLKFGICVSPLTVAKYIQKRPSGSPRGDQRWSTFLKNHAKEILACDFFVAVTATFRVLYVFIVIEHGTRCLRHVNVTFHPTADWTLQQLREVVGDEDSHRYLIHDRDRIFTKHLDDSVRALGIEVVRSPVASPKANAICERVIGTIRRECLDWMIPISEAHLRSILKEWVAHYNRGRAHRALGPGVPDPPPESLVIPKAESRHRLAAGALEVAQSVLGGLHHEYFRAKRNEFVTDARVGVDRCLSVYLRSTGVCKRRNTFRDGRPFSRGCGRANRRFGAAGPRARSRPLSACRRHATARTRMACSLEDKKCLRSLARNAA